MVVLVIHIDFVDKDNVELCRAAPKLPQGVCWQVGMWFCPTKKRDDRGYEVEQVWVDADGNVAVHFMTQVPTRWSKTAIGEFIKEGWSAPPSR